MPLEIGDVRYPTAPFSGWYLGTEIGARDLTDSDRYDLLPAVAAVLGWNRCAIPRCGKIRPSSK